MSHQTIACWAVLSAVVLTGCAGSSTEAGNPGSAGVRKVAATGTEQSLLSALNSERRAAGKAEVEISTVLCGLAREESDTAAASVRIPGDTTAALRSRSGFGSIGKLQGVLQDRGPATGQGFIEHWSRSQRGMMLDEWSKAGMGVSKAADGRLFAVVILGNEGSGSGGSTSLMNPAMSPGGL